MWLRHVYAVVASPLFVQGNSMAQCTWATGSPQKLGTVQTAFAAFNTPNLVYWEGENSAAPLAGQAVALQQPGGRKRGSWVAHC